jgi:DNA polymerase elongation subunit (family B)
MAAQVTSVPSVLVVAPAAAAVAAHAAAVRASFAPVPLPPPSLEFCVSSSSYRVTDAGCSIWLHGTNARAETVAVRVDGFAPYVYLDVGPVTMAVGEAQARARALADTADSWLRLLALVASDAGIGQPTHRAIAYRSARAVTSYELVTSGAVKSVGARAGYESMLQRHYVKLVLLSPTLVRPLRALCALSAADVYVGSMRAAVDAVVARVRAFGARAAADDGSGVRRVARGSAHEQRARAVAAGSRALLLGVRRARGDARPSDEPDFERDDEVDLNERLEALAAEAAADEDAADEAECALADADAGAADGTALPDDDDGNGDADAGPRAAKRARPASDGDAANADFGMSSSSSSAAAVASSSSTTKRPRTMDDDVDTDVGASAKRARPAADSGATSTTTPTATTTTPHTAKRPRADTSDRVRPLVLELRARFEGSGVLLPSDVVTAAERPLALFEADIEFVTRYAVDAGFAPEQWVRLVPELARERTRRPSLVAVARDEARETRADVEYVVRRPDGVVLVERAGAQDALPPRPLASLDIENETAAELRDTSARAQRVLVVVVSTVDVLVDPNVRAPRLVSFMLNRPAAREYVRGADDDDAAAAAAALRSTVYVFDGDECALLSALETYLAALQADLAGYNVENYDLPYLALRAAMLGLGDGAFGTLSRTLDRPARLKDTSFSSRGAGRHENKAFVVEGVLVYDVLTVMKRHGAELRDHSLGAVASAVLGGETKDDVAYADINAHARTPAGRERLRVYCVVDTLLPLRIVGRLELLARAIEQARVVGASLDTIVRRGQNAQQASLLAREARARSLRLYTLSEAERLVLLASPPFMGATVIEPVRGYYTLPVLTLDAEGLYPNILRTTNGCPSTRVAVADIGRLGLVRGRDTWTQVVNGVEYATYVAESTGVRGFVPGICDRLLDWRKRVKRELALAKTYADVAGVAAGEARARVTGGDGAAAAYLASVPKLAAVYAAAEAARARLAAFTTADALETEAARARTHVGVLDARQLGIKVTANSLYGMLGAKTSRCPDETTAEMVTRDGRYKLETMKTAIEAKYSRARGSSIGARVIYGDTDSVFVALDAPMALDDVGRLGDEMADLATSLFFTVRASARTCVRAHAWRAGLWASPMSPRERRPDGVARARARTARPPSATSPSAARTRVPHPALPWRRVSRVGCARARATTTHAHARTSAPAGARTRATSVRRRVRSRD